MVDADQYQQIAGVARSPQNPWWGAVLMSASTVMVALNAVALRAQLLKRLDLDA